VRSEREEHRAEAARIHDMRRCLVVVAVLTLPSVAHADREPVLPVDVAVTSDERGAVVDRAWIDAEMSVAERVYGPLGFHVRVDHVRPLGAELSHIEDPRMRDRFAPLVTAHEIQVFIVRSLRDSEVVGMYRNGVTWDSRPSGENGPSRRFIIVAATAAQSSLAHELGHFFGIQPHSSVKNNLMSYDREDALVFLDAAQQSIVKTTARALRTSGALDVLDWIER
jgi:hypothetical protein